MPHSTYIRLAAGGQGGTEAAKSFQQLGDGPIRDVREIGVPTIIDFQRQFVHTCDRHRNVGGGGITAPQLRTSEQDLPVTQDREDRAAGLPPRRCRFQSSLRMSGTPSPI